MRVFVREVMERVLKDSENKGDSAIYDVSPLEVVIKNNNLEMKNI